LCSSYCDIRNITNSFHCQYLKYACGQHQALPNLKERTGEGSTIFTGVAFNLFAVSHREARALYGVAFHLAGAALPTVVNKSRAKVSQPCSRAIHRPLEFAL